MGETKICEQCSKEKDVEAFRKVANKYTGVHRMSMCKECYNANNEATSRKIEQEMQEAREQRLREQARQPHTLSTGRTIARTEEQQTTESILAQLGAWYDGTWSWAIKKTERHTERIGKWMLWPVGIESREVWETICRLTRAKKLGVQAKIACRESRNSDEHLICVYTYDSDDKEDLQRVVDVLRSELDPKFRLIYKEDRMTAAGGYKGLTGDRPVSKWYVHPYETTIHAVKGYTPPEKEDMW